MILLEHILTNNRERNYSQIFEEFGEYVNADEFLPGHYYSFNISVPNFSEDLIPSSIEEYNSAASRFITQEKYYDLNPVGLVFLHDRWKENVLMLNLKAISPIYRPKIILTHLNIIEESLERINAFSEEDEIIPFNERKKLKLGMFGITLSRLEQESGIRLRSAISAYKIEGEKNKINNARVLDWNNIGELPLANIETKGIEFASGAYDISTVFDTFDNKQNNII